MKDKILSFINLYFANDSVFFFKFMLQTVFDKFFISVLTLGTMFLVLPCFVDEMVLPKIYCFIIAVFLGVFMLFFYKNQKKNKVDILTVSIILFVSYLLLVSITSRFYLKSIGFLGVVLFYFLCRQLSQKDLRYFDWSIVLVTFLQAVYGIFQYTGVLASLSSFPISGSFDNPAGFSSCLAIGVPFYLDIIKKNYSCRYYISSLLLVNLTAIMLSGSRAGILSVLIVFFCFLYGQYICVFDQKKKTQIFLFTLLFFITLAIMLFFWKKDSAIGRILIWKVTCNMIADSPILGFGDGFFRANYMLYQANYLKDISDSTYSFLADNIVSPFNEYLFLTVEFGMIGLFLLCGILFCFFCFNKNRYPSFIGVVISMIIFSLFSYPFRYPFVWVVVIYSFARISVDMPVICRLSTRAVSCVKIGILGLLVSAGFYLWKDICFEYDWGKIAHLSLSGKTKMVIEDYKDLYDRWNGNPYFLYNYGAELNYIGQYEKSSEILEECKSFIDDYPLRMLLADNAFYLKKWGLAKSHYEMAAYMCPNRFLPLQGLVNVYDSIDRPDVARKLALDIIEKKEKVPSAIVSQIKTRMLMRVEKSNL